MGTATIYRGEKIPSLVLPNVTNYHINGDLLAIIQEVGGCRIKSFFKDFTYIRIEEDLIEAGGLE